MARQTRQYGPPPSGAGEARWNRRAERALNGLAPTSVFSTSDGPESTITAPSGTIGIDIGSSATTFWAKASGTTTAGWQEISLQ